MKRPEKYTIIVRNLETGHIIEEQLTDWVHDHLRYKYQYDARYETLIFIDTRYEAKLRLYKYWLRKTNFKLWDRLYSGKSIYHGTEIGKTIPILNF